MRTLRALTRLVAAAGAGVMMIGYSAGSASATTPVPGYGFDGTAHLIAGGGSDTTWKIMLNLSTDYNISPGCPNTPPSSLPPNVVLDVCSSPVPTTNTLGNFDHDTVSQAYPTGSSAGIAGLNQDESGVPNAVCYSGGVAAAGALDPTGCGPTTGSRFVTDGATTDGSTTVTSASAAFTAADAGKPVLGETNIPTGDTIASVTNGTTVVLTSPAKGTNTGVSLEIGSVGPSISFARSSRKEKTSGGNCSLGGVGASELTCDTFWGFAEDGVQVSNFNHSACLGSLSLADLDAIWSGTVHTWGDLNTLDATTNALCVAGRAATDPIIPWGMNTASGTFGTFQGFIGAVSPVPSKPGTDQSLSTGIYPFENDIKPIVNDVVANGIPTPVNGVACAAGVSTTLSSPCDPDNWLWWGSFGVFKAFPYEAQYTPTSGTCPVQAGLTNCVGSNASIVAGKAPSASNILAGTYAMVRSLFHVTKKADADCAKTGSSCDFVGNPGPTLPSGSGTDLNVVGAPGNDAASGAIREFTRWLCRPGAADQAIDPFTGVNYDTVITGDIGASGFTKVPASLITTGSRCTVHS